MSHTDLNNWTPAIYSKTHRVNWTAERNKSYNREKSTVSIHCLGLFENYDSIKDIKREITSKKSLER